VGISHTSLHSFEEARNALETLLEECRDIGNTFSMVITASQLGRVQMRLGKIAESLETYQQALEVCRDQQGNLLPIASEAMVGLGELYLEMNDLDQAADYLLEGIELSRHWRDVAAMEGYLALALVKQAQSSPEAAQDAIAKSRKLAQDYEVSEIDNRRIELWQAKLWLAQGKLNLVAGWADNLGWKCIKEIEQVKKRDGISFYLFSRESLVVSQLKYLQGEYADALEWLDQQIPMFQTIGRLNALAELHLLKALVHEQMGDKATAITELRTALEIAEPAGFLRIFLDRGIGIKSLLRQAKAQNICQRYINQILSAFESPIPYNKDEPPPIVEPLSERELEVLRWLQTNLTTPEIADQMMIGVSTVRSHIKNIYSKLVVHKRSEAVNLAKKVGLI
jgi:LuxR family maltose regulon positive regulatory protein